MPDRVQNAASGPSASIRQAVNISTKKIFDSCKDKDCIDDLRVYPTTSSQGYIENAISLRAKAAQLLCVNVNVEPVSFNRGYYTVDCTYFYRITAETFPAAQECCGLAIFDKRVMLFGSEGSVKTFSSSAPQSVVLTDDEPDAVVSAVDPICLHATLSEAAPVAGEITQPSIPDYISAAFDEALVFSDTGRKWYTTIGQFSVVRLERDTQLLIPAYDYCMPDKECPGATEDDPCALFGRIRFPVEEFFPPDSVEESDEYRQYK